MIPDLDIDWNDRGGDKIDTGQPYAILKSSRLTRSPI